LKTRVVTAPSGLEEAVELLTRGDIVALPTETVYGLCADALNPLACAKIFEVKERPLDDPLIVHLCDLEWLKRLAKPNKLALRLAEEFWPGPLSMVLPRTNLVPDIVTSGQSTVALRMSAHPLFQEIARSYGGPIAAPSANRFGSISPTAASHVMKELGGRIALIVDGGLCVHGLESTIVLVREHGVEILRHGPITKERLSEFVMVLSNDAHDVTPGSMASHYAPCTPLKILPFMDPAVLDNQRKHWPEKTGLLLWSQSGEGFAAVEYLSRKQDLREAAANFYSALRRLDEAGVDLIVAEGVPEVGLGVAIMERLRKAASRE
jgi:L-threonylcarbamoyladenylate synthase